MSRIRYIHWKPTEARERIAYMKGLGHRVSYTPIESQATLPRLRTPRPDVIVIDLGRLPGGGRDVAMWFRRDKATRGVPILFVDGEEAKLGGIRRQIPGAHFAPWRRIRAAIAGAIAAGSPPAAPVPASTLAGYSGTPLPKKLGIKPGMAVLLSAAPAGFAATLGPLPEGATLRRRGSGPARLVIWFVRSKAALLEGVRGKGESLEEGGGLWIAWPKQSSGLKTDLTQSDVRREGLASGLVDYKICAIDATWSGLKFARRKG